MPAHPKRMQPAPYAAGSEVVRHVALNSDTGGGSSDTATTLKLATSRRLVTPCLELQMVV